MKAKAVKIGRTRVWRIKDKFSKLKKRDGTPASRQHKYILRKTARGICQCCTKPAIGVYCLEHMIKYRERMRRKNGYRRRLKSSLSYRLEKAVH